MKKIVAVFDFDGTITTKDTFLQFIRFTKGAFPLYFGFMRHLPLLLLAKSGLYPAGKAKQRIFAYFFKGMEYAAFCEWGRKFSCEVEKLMRPQAAKAIASYREEGSKVYIVSASIEEWIVPFAEKLGIYRVLGTQVEVRDGIVTGKFLSENCNGKEKINRFLQQEPARGTYLLYAYGDSAGDKALLDFADKSWFKRFS
jgi:HAD superfamily hydrolase (TIGR01490 family)